MTFQPPILPTPSLLPLVADARVGLPSLATLDLPPYSYPPAAPFPYQCIATSQKLSQTPSKSASLTQDITEKVTYLSSPNPYPTVKMDLPTFSNLDSEDPIDFIDRFEEYNELRPLHHEELLAALSEKVWQRLRQKDEQLTKSAQMFMLANGQSQKTQGKVCWQCEIYGVKQEITFYVMEDENLAVPVILGVDFLKKAGVVIDFNASRVYLPDVNSSHPMCFNDVHEPASIPFYVAQGEGAMHNEEELKLIDQAVESSNASVQTYRLTCTISNKCFTVCTRPVSH
ncbi:gastrula zinc finger -like protein [Labeo rohita]|uniref:Gastrula zinc finger-like protein n=1 Tax=Labeo rohita TaxID=84645 RepID=A0A498MHY0_LABRO|nr:gastrula zinc finger -like protein [Labeo rohita]